MQHFAEHSYRPLLEKALDWRYTTAAIGKWHLGWDWSKTAEDKWQKIDFAQPVANGPDINGFDGYYAHCGSLDMAPYVYIENDRVVEPPTGRTAGRKGKAFYRAGPSAPTTRPARRRSTRAWSIAPP